MFCVKCGKEIPEDSKVCMYCGGRVEGQNGDEMGNGVITPSLTQKETRKKKPFWKKVVLGIIAVVVVISVISGLSGGESEESDVSEENILTELQTFTTLYKDEDDRYLFLDENEKWIIVYTEENEFVAFYNDAVQSCFTDNLGMDCFAEESISNGGFGYDIDENEARIYMDVETDDGHLSIVNCNFDDGEYILNIDGKHYTTTDVFDDMVKEYDLTKNMEADVETFKSVLKTHDLALEDLLELGYKTIDESFVPEEG